ncbi:MAG: stage III sporulation protein AD [Bacillota bacterium]|nr:stage III sporulation protein AD [Bacillota bacterium]
MEIVRLAGIGLIAAVLALLLRAERPELAIQVSIAAGALLLLLTVGRLVEVLELLLSLVRRAGLDLFYLNTVLKIIGVGYLVGFAAQICRDAGERAVAEKLELAGKVAIMALALPILLAVVDAVTRILP